MSNLNNIRLSLKIDDLSNWNNNSDIVLNDGEIALIRFPNGLIKIKIGDGKTNIQNLNYVNENVGALTQGLLNKNNSNNLVAGLNLSAFGNFQQVLGYNTEALSTDNFSFIWNGNNTFDYENRYTSHGPGTFQINPKNNLSGFYIGEQNMSQLLDKLAINGKKINTLSIENISQQDYHQLILNNEVLSNVLYIVSSDSLNMYEQQIKNLAPATDLSDAVNLKQLQDYVEQYFNTYVKTYIDNTLKNIS